MQLNAITNISNEFSLNGVSYIKFVGAGLTVLDIKH